MKKILSAVIAASLCLIPFDYAEYERVSAAENYVMNFTESTDIISSFDSGYTSASWIRTAPGKDWSTNVDRYTLLLIGIGEYSSGMGAADSDFDEIFFKSFESVLQSAETNGVTVGIRFRYDDNGTTNPEPASFEQVLRHIEQIGESGLLDKYQSVISFVESGMVGSWGEHWGGKYTSLEHKAIILDKFLDIVPNPIPVTVRTPNTFRQWLSDFCGVTVTAANMGNEVQKFLDEGGENAKKAARVGMYNDGYMGSDSDLGTYSNRTGETDWLSFAPAYGGEFSGSDEWRMKYVTWLPENAITEMYKTDLVRINSNIYKEKTASKEYDTQAEAEARLNEIGALYKAAGIDNINYSPSVTQTDTGKYLAKWNWLGYDSFTFDKTLDSKLGVKCDNSAFYGENCFTFIRTHLGYRFVIRSMDITKSADSGDMFKMDFTVENTGFSEAPTYKETEIILKKGNVTYTYKTDINAGEWNGGEKAAASVNVKLPETMSGGQWEVYLRISNENEKPEQDNMFCTRLANKDVVYDTELGANLVGTINISGQEAPADKAAEDKRPAGYYPESRVISLNDEDKAVLLDKKYNLTEDGHYGFTFLYKIEGVKSEIQLGNWYSNMTIGGTGFASAYTTYGLNTMNLKIQKDGYYAIYVPFYGCAFNCTTASSAGNSLLSEFTINDSRNYWSADTITKLNGNNVKITPIGFVEGGCSGYDVTFHLAEGDKHFSSDDKYGFNDSDKSQSIKNKEAVTVMSLLGESVPKGYTDETGTWKFVGFTTKEGDGSGLIDDNFIAFGDIELYPYYEPDIENTDFSKLNFVLTNGADFQGVRYTLDKNTRTAIVGDASDWMNNSGYSGSSSVVIPAKVTSDGVVYTVKNTDKNPFYYNVKVYRGNINIVSGDVDGNGAFEIADIVMLQKWLVKAVDTLANPAAAEMTGDNVLNIFDLCIMKHKMIALNK